MIMKIPSNTVGSGYYGDTLDFDNDDFDGSNDFESVLDDDFSEYLWMENEEEFDKLEMERLEEEALMEQCIEAMLQDELDEEQQQQLASLQPAADWSNTSDSQELCQVLSSLKVLSTDDVENSTLNPLAEEFVPNNGPILVPAST